MDSLFDVLHERMFRELLDVGVYYSIESFFD